MPGGGGSARFGASAQRALGRPTRFWRTSLTATRHIERDMPVVVDGKSSGRKKILNGYELQFWVGTEVRSTFALTHAISRIQQYQSLAYVGCKRFDFQAGHHVIDSIREQLDTFDPDSKIRR
jgi:hypothetical protein